MDTTPILFGRKRQPLPYFGKTRWIDTATAAVKESKTALVAAEPKAGLSAGLEELLKTKALRHYDKIMVRARSVRDEASLAWSFSAALNGFERFTGANGHSTHTAMAVFSTDSVKAEDMLSRLENTINVADNTPLVVVDDAQRLKTLPAAGVLLRKLLQLSREGRIGLVLGEHPVDGRFKLSDSKITKAARVTLDAFDYHAWYNALRVDLKRYGIRLKEMHFKWMASWANEAPGDILRMVKMCDMTYTIPLRKRTLVEALENNHMVNSTVYDMICGSLGRSHLSYLYALARGETQLSATATLEKYDLGTSANSIKIRRALSARGILVHPGSDQLRFADPFFRSWFKKVFLHDGYQQQIEALDSPELETI